MSSNRKVRHGHVTRHQAAAEAPPPAAEAVPAPAAAAEQLSPPAASEAAPPAAEEFTGGARRSVFDLLKEKYPDLSPAKKTASPPQNAAAAKPVAPPKPSVAAEPAPLRREPPKVELPKIEPAPLKTEPIEPAETAALASVLALRQAEAALPAFEQTEPSAPTPVVLPKSAARWRPRPKVVGFWLGVASLFAAGTYVLASLKPGRAPRPAATATTAALVPEDSAAAALSARELTLEPEKVVVSAPPEPPKPKVEPPATAKSSKPPAPVPKPLSRAEKRQREREAAKKAAEAKKNDSQILIEQVPPVVPPLRTGGSQPEYPVAARAAGVEGTVVLFGVIGRDGKVKNARVVRGLSAPLDAAALAAFRTWSFKPATQKGKKVEFKYNAGIEFRINSPAEQVAAPQITAPQLAELPPAPAAPPAAGPPASALSPLAYGGEFTPPVRITMVWPQKPYGAQMVKGEVKLQLAVAADGSVREVEVLEGLPQGVTEAAIEAVRQWKFKPARQSGEPVAVYHRVSLRF